MPQPYLSELDQLHREWEEVHTRLRVLEQQLSNEISLYARGQGARPDELIVEVEALRAECAQRFQALMAAAKRAPDLA